MFKKKALRYIQALLMLSIGVAAISYIYSDIEFDKIYPVLDQLNYSWLLIALTISITSHFLRSLRWNIVLEKQKNRRNSKANSFLTVMVGYMTNLIIPRAGEVARAAALAKYEDRSTSKLIGTIVQERLVDLIMLGVVIVIALISSFDMIYDTISTLFIDKFDLSTLSIIAGGLVIVTIVGALYIKKNWNSISKIKIVNDFLSGLTSFSKIRNWKAYLIYTVGIWAAYFAMTYLMFFAFPSLEALPLSAGLAVLVFGTFGMIAPVQGGLGAWHVMVILALSFYSIPDETAKIYALIAHTSMNLIVIIVGLISTILLPIINRNRI